MAELNNAECQFIDIQKNLCGIYQDITWSKNVYRGKAKRRKRKPSHKATPGTRTVNCVKTEVGSEALAEVEPWEGDSLAPAELKKRITFLIGNGFDINVGLHTRYRDFYEYYIENNKGDMLAKAIGKDYDNWSDLELGLGKYTGKVSPEKEKEFWNSEPNLEDSLVDYLTEEVKKINLDALEKKKEIASGMTESLLKFYENLQDDAQNAIEKILAEAKLQYSFINFNYTDVLDRCLKIIWLAGVLESKGDEDVLHIHGTISGSMVLGVNDESQIANKEFRNNIGYRRLLIKKEINEFCGKGDFKKARDIIDASSIICIYGMSIGMTDKMWWQYLGKWLQEDDNRRLVIFAKGNTNHKVKKYSGSYGEKVKNQFRDNGELGDLWDQIESKIYVEVNANIFNFKLV